MEVVHFSFNCSLENKSNLQYGNVVFHCLTLRRVLTLVLILFLCMVLPCMHIFCMLISICMTDLSSIQICCLSIIMVFCQGCVCDSCLVCNLGRGGAIVCLLCLYLYNYFITLHDCVAATGRKCTLF